MLTGYNTDEYTQEELPDELVIPDYISGYPVVAIDFKAFANTKLKAIELPSTLKKIDG